MLTIDKSISTTYPGTKIGILVMKGISYSGSYDESEKTQILNKLGLRYGHLQRKDLKELYPIAVYVAYYKRFGYNYHLLAQLESVLKGKKALPAESGLLQAMFLAELDSMLLTAGHDAARLQLPLQLKTATGTEAYESISGKVVTAVSGDMMLCDGRGTISSILRGPDYKSRITSSITEVLFSIYAPPGIDADSIETNLKKLEKSIRAFSPSSKTELLQIFSQG